MVNNNLRRIKKIVENRVYEINKCEIYNVKSIDDNIIKFIIDYEYYSTTPEASLKTIIERIVPSKNFIVKERIEWIFDDYYKMYIIIIDIGE